MSVLTKDYILARIKIDEQGCWILQKAIGDSGYGQISYKLDGQYHSVRAHRASYELFKGPLKNQALHKCHVPACVNPEHLYDGTDLDNRTDMYAAGRQAHAKGSQVGTSKLTESMAKFIRNSSIPATVLAPALGVSTKAIYQIRRGETWKHIS